MLRRYFEAMTPRACAVSAAFILSTAALNDGWFVSFLLVVVLLGLKMALKGGDRR